MTGKEVCARAAKATLKDPPGAAEGAGLVLALKAAAGSDTQAYQRAYALVAARCRVEVPPKQTRVLMNFSPEGQGTFEVVHGASGGQVRRWAAKASLAKRRKLLEDVARGARQ